MGSLGLAYGGILEALSTLFSATSSMNCPSTSLTVPIVQRATEFRIRTLLPLVWIGRPGRSDWIDFKTVLSRTMAGAGQNGYE
jgi:hypothetical protein